jgi:hypothetical protein
VEHRLQRNRLKGVASDTLNAILSATAMNFHKTPGSFLTHFSARPDAHQGLDSGPTRATPPPNAVCKCLKSTFQDRLLYRKLKDKYLLVINPEPFAIS